MILNLQLSVTIGSTEKSCPYMSVGFRWAASTGSHLVDGDLQTGHATALLG